MPVFKNNNRARGGAVRNGFNSPGFGLGLEYIPTAQELPDLEGLMYVEQAKNNARAQLETLRKEYTPDVTALTEPLNDLEMFGSIKNDFKRDIQGKIADFKSKMAADPDFAFSMEARNEYNSLINNLNSSDYQYQALRYKELKDDYDNSLKNGLGNSFYISNGQIPLVNMKSGEIEMKSVEEAKKILTSPETNMNYSMFNKSNQIWDYYHKYADKKFNSFLPFSGRSTVKDAKSEIEQVFKNVATSVFEGIKSDDIADKSGMAVYQMLKEKSSSNREQLEAAMQQTKNTLSQGSLDALRGDYIQRYQDLSQEGFEKYLESYLSGEAIIRDNTSTTIDANSSILSAEQQKGFGGVSGNMGEPMETTDGISLRDNNYLPEWWNEDRFDTPIISKSSVMTDPYSVENQKTFIGKMAYYSDDASSTGAKGGLKSANKTLYNVTSRGFYLMPVSTGQVIRLNSGKYTIAQEDGSVKPGVMLNSTQNSNLIGKGDLKITSTEKQEIEIDGVTYLVYPGKEKNQFIVAAPKAFGMYHGFDDKDLGEKSETIVFRALDPTESTQTFSSPEFSLDYKSKKFFDENTNSLKPEGRKQAAYILDAMQGHITSLENRIAGSKNPVETKQFVADMKAIDAQKKQVEMLYQYIDAVSSGEEVLTDEESVTEYEGLRFRFNLMLNQANTESQISNVKRLTTVINNSFKATTKYNNLTR